MRILFQGDSITDTGRNYDDNTSFGTGYACMLAGQLGYRYPGKMTFVNKGISGNRVVDLYARWKIDCLNLEPDYLSILIGVNDVWQELTKKNGVDVEKFQKVYNMLIEETLEKLPNTVIMLMEPFVLHGCDTDENWEFFNSEINLRREAVHGIAQKFNLPVIPLQSKFNEMIDKMPEIYWTKDGVHPTVAGHALIAEQWLEVFNGL